MPYPEYKKRSFVQYQELLQYIGSLSTVDILSHHKEYLYLGIDRIKNILEKIYLNYCCVVKILFHDWKSVTFFDMKFNPTSNCKIV